MDVNSANKIESSIKKRFALFSIVFDDFGLKKGLKCDKKLIPFIVCRVLVGFGFHCVHNSTISAYFIDNDDGV